MPPTCLVVESAAAETARDACPLLGGQPAASTRWHIHTGSVRASHWVVRKGPPALSLSRAWLVEAVTRLSRARGLDILKLDL